MLIAYLSVVMGALRVLVAAVRGDGTSKPDGLDAKLAQQDLDINLESSNNVSEFGSPLRRKNEASAGKTPTCVNAVGIESGLCRSSSGP